MLKNLNPIFQSDLFLKQNGIESACLVRLATEGALFASLIEHGIPRDFRIHADDAGQFAVFINSLCWIHEERHYRKFQVFNTKTEQVVGGTRSEEGRDARDTFLSLIRTAQKLKVSFLDYLKDRLSETNKIPRFGDLIRAGGYQPAAP